MRQVLSCYMSATTCMNEGEKDGEDSEDGEEEGETAAAKETEEISRKDAEIRRFMEERRCTPQEEKQRLKEVNKCIKKCFRDKKRVKRQQVIQRILEDFKGVSIIPGIKSAKKKVLITKIKNERGEIITSRNGTLVNSTKNFTTTMSKTDMEMKATLTCTLTTPKK